MFGAFVDVEICLNIFGNIDINLCIFNVNLVKLFYVGTRIHIEIILNTFGVYRY